MWPRLQFLGPGLKAAPGVRAVASRGSSIAVRLVRVLIEVLVVLLHERRVVPAVLRARRQAVAVLPCSLVVIVLVRRHQAVAFNRRKVRCCRVVAVSVSLGLFERENRPSVRCCLFGSYEHLKRYPLQIGL